jgi:hypothetical protein
MTRLRGLGRVPTSAIPGCNSRKKRAQRSAANYT